MVLDKVIAVSVGACTAVGVSEEPVVDVAASDNASAASSPPVVLDKVVTATDNASAASMPPVAMDKVPAPL